MEDADRPEGPEAPQQRPPAVDPHHSPIKHKAGASGMPPPAGRKGHGCLTYVVAVVVLLLIGCWFYRRHAQAAAAAAAAAQHKEAGIPVTVATATTGSVGVYLTAIGTITPVYTAAITAQASGVVTAVHYLEGQMVAKGDPLVDIDPSAYQAQLDEAQGTLVRDQALLDEAKMDLERYQAAWAQNAIQRQQLEDQEKVVGQDQGTVKNDQGLVQYDQVQLSYCHITAPIAGRVGLRLVDPGNIVAANGSTTLVVITQVNPITAIFTIAGTDLGQVAPAVATGRRLPVDLWDAQQQHQIAAGTLASIDNQMDTTTGTVKLRATFDNSNGKLYPNQFVFTRLQVRTLKNQTLVPASAVQRNGDAAFVYLIQNNKAVLKAVTTGITDNNLTAVTGIQAGDVVANSSFDKLMNGAAITISKEPLPATDTGTDPIP